MKLGFVVPRYGTEVVGGAESGARMIAERLNARPEWSVEVFSTCAKDHMSWADEYPAGTEVINGVPTHRFPVTSGRPAAFFPYSERVLAAPWAATQAEAQTFLDLQGPGCEPLTDAVAGSDCDILAFYPYLYNTTVRTLPEVAKRAILHPAAHDEPAIHLPTFRDLFALPAGLVFQTWGERDMVQKMFPVAQTPQIVVGLGFEEAPHGSDPTGRRRPPAIADLGDRPYVLCLGRVDGFKGTTMLAGFFAAYKERNPGPLALVLAGPVTAHPPGHQDIVVTGPVDEVDKWDLISAASILVNPSPHESFSLVLTEAWSRDLPVVVNGRCDATREHCERSGGGLWFESYAEFESIIARLSGDRQLREVLGVCGRAYVDDNFRWPTIIDRYSAFAQRIASRAAS